MSKYAVISGPYFPAFGLHTGRCCNDYQSYSTTRITLWQFPLCSSTKTITWLINRSSHQRCSVKKMFLEISQNSQESTCSMVFVLIKLQVWSATLLRKRLWHRCFPVNFAKFLRAPLLQNTSRRLLLY